MTEKDKRKSVMYLVRTFEINPQKETKKNPEPKKNVDPKKEKVKVMPFKPTPKEKVALKPCNQTKPKDKNDIEEGVNTKCQTFAIKTNQQEQNTNPFLAMINKNKKIKDDSNKNWGIKNEPELKKENEWPEVPKRRKSFEKIEDVPKIENLGETGGDIPEVDEPVIPLTYKQTEELLKDPKFEKVKTLKDYTDREFTKTVTDKNKGHANIVKSLVSQDKTRFCYDGFDLDLTYVTTRIIAMGFPSSSLEGIYRNNMETVKKFFAKRHPNHYKVYNLCDDKKYPPNSFYKQDSFFCFKDHEAPPLNIIRPFCEDAKKFLDEDEQNVVAIHCKAGKGRTGTLICCLLLYLKFFETAEESLLYYGLMRVGSVKGVTVPSQIRYVHYFESILKNNIPHPIKFKVICIKKVKMYTIPKIGKKKYTILFTIENQDRVTKYSDINKKKETYTVTSYDLPYIEFPMTIAGLQVCGDVRFLFYQALLLKKEKMFKFWFNTNFLPPNGTYEIRKEGIDKACKDKKCKVYKEDFKIEIEYIYV
jgi:phosphatidylinositol-3,4,5-trisphosphate 3-phosphatase/dual-specificity protein phosphatase PTEN